MSRPHPLEISETSPVDGLPFTSFDNYQAVTDEYLGSPDALHNSSQRTPNQIILSEKPEHRLILYLKLNGHSTSQIANLTGYTPTYIRQIVRQPWFQKKFTEEAKAAGLDAVSKFLETETLESLEVVRALRDDPKQPGNTRLAAANSLLDRHLGKPTQKVVTDNTHRNIDEVGVEADAVNREIKRIEETLKNRGITE